MARLQVAPKWSVIVTEQHDCEEGWELGFCFELLCICCHFSQA